MPLIGCWRVPEPLCGDGRETGGNLPAAQPAPSPARSHVPVPSASRAGLEESKGGGTLI